MWPTRVRSIDRVSQGLSDKSSGALMLSCAAIVFAYYTVWTILLVSNVIRSSVISVENIIFSQPVFDTSSPIHRWFPSREWAVRIPAFILVIGISAIGIFLGAKVVQEHRTTCNTKGKKAL